MNKQSFCFLSLKTQFENAGDALIVRELLRLCSRYSNVYVDTSRCPAEFVRSVGIDRYAPEVKQVGNLDFLLRLISRRLLGHTVYFFLPPGGCVGEKSGLQFVKFFLTSLLIAVMNVLGIRVCQVGVSYERLGASHARMLSFRSHRMYRNMVRDTASSTYGKGLGIRIHGTSPDLAFSASSYCRTSNEHGNRIAFSFRVDRGEWRPECFENLVCQLDRALDVGFTFRFVAQVARDVPFMRRLAAQQYSRGRIIEYVESFSDVDLTLAAHTDNLCIVSNRLHALLCGVIQGVTPIPLADEVMGRKVFGFFQTLKQPTFSLVNLEGTVCAILAAARSGTDGVGNRDLAVVQERILQKIFSGIFQRTTEVVS